MEILYYFEDKDTFMDKWQHFHIVDELKRYDCNIEIFSPIQYETIDQANQELINLINRRKFDLFMTPYNHNIIYIETLEKIKLKGISTLLICFDNLLIPYHHKKIAKFFDLVWLTSKETMNLFKSWGATVIFLPYAANPYNFKPKALEEINKICFVGTPYGSRINLINYLVNESLNVDLYTRKENIAKANEMSSKILQRYSRSAYDLFRYNIGRKVAYAAMIQKIKGSNKLDIDNKQLNFYEPVDFTELSGIYSRYSLSLSSTSARNTGVLNNPVNVVNLRSFEIPMSGGLQICAHFDEIAEYFEEDKEIILYKSNDELIEKSAFYTKDQNIEVRNRIKTAARKRAEGEHTWYQRFRKIFEYLHLGKF